MELSPWLSGLIKMLLSFTINKCTMKISFNRIGDKEFKLAPGIGDEIIATFI